MNSTTGFSLPDDNDRLLELGRLAGGLVHELKNPLGVISLNAELLREQIVRTPAGGERERMERRLTRILESAQNLQAIVQSFLQFARPGRPDPVAADVNAVLRKVIDEQSEANAASDVQVIFRPDDGLRSVPADPLHLASIFRNVLVNARDALRERQRDRRVLVATRSAHDSIRVVIANNGPAISERVAAHLFQPFTSSKENGTGLGLAIVRRLVEMHRGTVHVSSDRDTGVSFTFEFPTPLGPARARTELPMPSVEAVVRNPDDSATTRAIYGKGAPPHSDGATVRKARGGEQAPPEAVAAPRRGLRAAERKRSPPGEAEEQAQQGGPLGRRGKAPGGK